MLLAGQPLQDPLSSHWPDLQERERHRGIPESSAVEDDVLLLGHHGAATEKEIGQNVKKKREKEKNK